MSDERDASARFVRGLTLGALLGAVVAGSSLWSRSRARRAGSLAHLAPPATPTETPLVPATDAAQPRDANERPEASD